VALSRVRCCPSSLYTFAPADRPARLARDCHVKGFPEFEQFCIPGFPQEHSSFVQVPCVYQFRHARFKGGIISTPRPGPKEKPSHFNGMLSRFGPIFGSLPARPPP
jgi:hypothetical protein